ncbi:MAG: peptidoglycan-binding domain-containing protein [Candidatus Omnitrophota bacterium]|nr:peptidoglycan-binding domain-containing protein [Candidatus Omnitrophota bacterium]
MRVGSLLTLAMGLVLISGCAGPRYAREITRLQADVGLLDQRVNQLERASLHTPQSRWPSESWRQPLTPAARIPARPAAAPVQPSTRDIQGALKNAGFDPGPIDGKLGSRTRQAIREFQGVNGLQVDGVVGKGTWAKLAPFLDLEASDDKAWAARPAK